MDIGIICTRPIQTIARGDSVAFAAQEMTAHDVGALVTVLDDGYPEGILTDRDIVTRCVGSGLPPESTLVSDIMTEHVYSLCEDMPAETALETMAEAGIRRLVVVNSNGRAIGLLSLDDLLSGLVDETGEIGRLLRVQVGV